MHPPTPSWSVIRGLAHHTAAPVPETPDAPRGVREDMLAAQTWVQELVAWAMDHPGWPAQGPRTRTAPVPVDLDNEDTPTAPMRPHSSLIRSDPIGGV